MEYKEEILWNSEAHIFIFLTWSPLICGAMKTTSKRDWEKTALENIFKYWSVWYNQQNNTYTMVVHARFKNAKRDFKVKVMKYLRDYFI